jgi:5-methylcytosine-specific restriction endonuclease McrA
VSAERKRCTGPCGKEKHREEFAKRSAAPDGLQGKCKACCKAYYQENRDRILAIKREYQATNSADISRKRKAYRQENPEKIQTQKAESYARHADRNREKKRKHREENRETVLTQQRASYSRNRAARNAANREYYAANRDRLLAQMRAWSHANRDRVSELNREWRANNPDRVSELRARRRARKASVPHEPYSRDDIFARWSSACAYCDAPATALDHVTPIALGGADAEWNLVPACTPCNSSKGAKTLADWAATF